MFTTPQKVYLGYVAGICIVGGALVLKNVYEMGKSVGHIEEIKERLNEDICKKLNETNDVIVRWEALKELAEPLVEN